MTVSDLERQVAATMWMAADKPRMAERAVSGKLDDHPASELIQRLSHYRAEFVHNASFGLLLAERDAMNAAADYHQSSACDWDIFVPGLRNGFLYPNDLIGRAFMLLHRLLVKDQPVAAKQIAAKRP